MVDSGLRVWCGGGVVAQFPSKVKWRQGVHRHGQRYMHRGTAEARTGAWVRVSVCVCDGIQEEEDSKGGIDGKERDTRGKCQDLSPCLVFIRAQEARAHTESSREAGWALGTADQEAQRCRGGFSYDTVSVLGCFEPVACLLSD